MQKDVTDVVDLNATAWNGSKGWTYSPPAFFGLCVLGLLVRIWLG
jgi:hypothetical protein